MYALIIVSLVWALSFGLIKGQLTGIDPILVSTIRLVLCGLTFAVFIRFNQSFRFQLQLFTLGIVQFGVMYWAYIQSYQYLPGYLVAVFTIFTPIYVLLISAFYQRRLSWTLFAPILLSIGGAAIIVFKAPQSTDWLNGFFILQVANIAFAFGQVTYKNLTKTVSKESDSQPNNGTSMITHHLSNMGIMYLGACVFITLVASINNSFANISEISSKQWLILLYLGVIASGVCFALWNFGAKQVSTSSLAIMNNGYIPCAVLFSLSLFGENANIEKLIIGSALMLISLWLANKVNIHD